MIWYIQMHIHVYVYTANNISTLYCTFKYQKRRKKMMTVHLSIYVSTYLCIYVSMYVYGYIYIYIYIYIHIYVGVLYRDLKHEAIAECFRLDKARTASFLNVL